MTALYPEQEIISEICKIAKDENCLIEQAIDIFKQKATKHEKTLLSNNGVDIKKAIYERLYKF